MDRTMRQLRTVDTRFETREAGEVPHISGYFAVFNSTYDIVPGVMSESIAPGAFDGVEADDIRALTNHDTTLILGRTAAGTMEIRQDDKGLWADITINPNDQDALNTWHRVQRGDVTQCSIGFDIIDEAAEYRTDGSTHWVIRKIRLYEVSVCTFPAYEETNVQARSKDRDALLRRKLDAWKADMRRRLSHAEGTDAQEKD